jgi:hypothetical protein
MMRKFPYGESNFAKVSLENYVYVDKTKYIEVMENLHTSYHFFLRPRRFGKSLFASMLYYYYGTEHKANFENLFGNFYIGKNPTPKANKYLVLNFEFSGIDTTTYETTLQGFLRNAKKGVEFFLKNYNHLFSEQDKQRILAANFPNELLQNLFLLCQLNDVKKPIYIIIDEYDHFANEIIAFNFNNFPEIVSRNGFVRKFYEVIKTATMEGVVDKLFVTGVTPITLDSMTSGFNIATDLTMHASCNEMMGFTFEEVKELVAIACKDQNCDKELIYKDLRDWYNGYLFSGEASTRVYNSDMVLYFLKQLSENNKYPKIMLDSNIASDYKKIKYFFVIKNPEQNYEVLDELLTNGEINSDITEKFSFERKFTYKDFASMLFYMGFVSIKDMMGRFYNLQMPNYVIKDLYYDFFAEILDNKIDNVLETKNLHEAITALAYKGNAQLFANEVQKVLKALSNRDAIKFTEKHLKVVIFTLLNISKMYFIKSEYETEKKYVDLLLLERKPFAVNFQYAIELKYLPKERANEAETVKNQAITQLKGYLQTEELRELKNLQSLIFMIVGDDLEMVELS